MTNIEISREPEFKIDHYPGLFEKKENEKMRKDTDRRALMLMAGILILVAAFVFVTLAPAFAQKSPSPAASPSPGDTQKPGMRGPGMRGPGMRDPNASKKIYDALNLTDDQKAKWQAVVTKKNEEIRKLHEDNTLSRPEKMAKLRSIRDSIIAEMNKILTPEQQKKLAQLKEEQHKKFAQMRQGKQQGVNPMKDLNLTDDQKSKIEAIRQGKRKEAEAVRSDASLSPEQKAEKIKGIQKKTMDETKKILTPEQQKKYEAMMAGGPGKPPSKGPAGQPTPKPTPKASPSPSPSVKK